MRRTRHRNTAEGGIRSGRIPLISLVQFIAVAEYLNFRHAANALGVAQSSVSARVKALEEDLGILLFERHARGVRLTDAGRHFVERVAAGIDQLDHAVKTANMAAVGESGVAIALLRGIIYYAHRFSGPLRFWKVEALPENNFQATWEKAAGPYPQAALGAGSWELENTALRALRDKIRTGRKTLKDVYGSPLYGIKTGLNGAFVIDNTTKERLCAQDPRSAELLKPFLEGKDLKRWRAEPRGLWLIYIPKNRIEIDDYPAIRDWLLPFKDKLEARATKQEWFELQQAQDAYISNFESKKIIYSEFNRRYFSISDRDTYFNNKIFMMASDDMALLALLQSTLFWFLFVSMTPQVIGGSRELRAQYVETVPIPTWTGIARAELVAASEQASKAAQERLTLQTALTRRIPDLCPPDRDPKLTTRLQEWWTLPDFAAFRAEVKKVFKADIPLAERSAWEDWIIRDRAEIARLSAEITKAEAQIDSIVYGLFDLTPDEIALLESVV